MLYKAFIEDKISEKKTIIVDKNRSYTYLDLHKKSLEILAYLRERGVKKGDRVVIKGYNDGATVAAILACLAGGMIFVPVSGRLSSEELEYIMEDCSPAAVLDAHEACYTNHKDVFAGERTRVSPTQGAYILYTSGTTGEKKGVFSCQKQILFCCKSILERLEYRESDRVLCSLPLEFDYGLYQVFFSLLSKAQLFLADSNIIQMIPQYLHQWEITIYPTIPSVANLLLKLGFLQKVKLPCLERITFTGEYLSPELIRNLSKALPLVEIIPMYGTTECKRIAVMPRGRGDKVAAGSCGLPLSGVKVYFEKAKEDDSAAELIVEGPNVMEGYWGAEDGGGFGRNPITGVRTYCTGDLLSVDEEGFLYFHGRNNGLIKLKGRRISELEVERLVAGIDYILECAVIGLRDTLYGEKIGICVYSLDENAEVKIKRMMEQKTDFANMCTIFLFPSPLPKNENGKIDKKTLKRIIYERNGHVLGK